MAEGVQRISQVARKLNVGRNTILEFLAEKGYEVDRRLMPSNTNDSPESLRTRRMTKRRLPV